MTKMNPRRWALVSAVLLALIGFFPLLGLPGALLYEKWGAVFGALNLEGLLPPLAGDRTWPIAIMVSIGWPWFIPLTYWAGYVVGLKTLWPWLLPAYLVWTPFVCYVFSKIEG